ncbi:helix-turn-helix domain-containing protein [Amphritea sp. HPY]|uniref:helix-turn-helix domain-containing protein n=1 Tax=Amphritea sp. HPY TaxID=3421652 RepID=UPI003D7F1760
MNKPFNSTRLKLARIRRKLTFKALAEAVGMSSKMVSLYEKDDCLHEPPKDTVDLLAKALNYPPAFFYGSDIEALEPSTVSFRSLKSMKAAQQHAAIGAGQIAFILNDFFESKFNLPATNLPDLRGLEPEVAAESLRERWGLGNLSIKNMIHLLESKGIRVFSLAENTQDVDAFSFWKDGIPFIFLNNQKSSERSRFDAAHELGHLVLHKHGGPTGREVEIEADKFSSSFLIPRSSLLEASPSFVTLDDIIKLKRNWLVSVGATIVRMKHLNLLTEWQYRTLMVEMSKAGYRKTEPNSIERERSLIIEKVLPALLIQGITLPKLADQLELPLDEVASLLFKVSIATSNNKVSVNRKNPPKLSLVKSN